MPLPHPLKLHSSKLTMLQVGLLINVAFRALEDVPVSDVSVVLFSCRKTAQPAFAEAGLLPCVGALLPEGFVRRQSASWSQTRLQAQVSTMCHTVQILIKWQLTLQFFPLSNSY